MPVYDTDDALLDELTKQSITECRVKGMTGSAISKKYKITQRQLCAFVKDEIRNYLISATTEEAATAWRDLAMSRLECLVERLMPLLLEENGPKTRPGTASWKMNLDSLLKIMDQQTTLLGTNKTTEKDIDPRFTFGKGEEELQRELKMLEGGG